MRPERRSILVGPLVVSALLLVVLPLVHAAPDECVVLLHGLARTARSMQPVADALKADYAVANVSYPSRHKPIEELVPQAIGEGVRRCRAEGAARIHFVTHSLGGILVRVYLATHTLNDLGRVVMLGPPNAGSEIVDHIHDLPGFAAYNGPAGLQLGTGAASVPRRLGLPTFELGIIAGTKSRSPFARYLPGPNDGKVSVASARLEGMQDFLLLPVSHTFMMRDERALAAIKMFLREGRFSAIPVVGQH